LRAVRGQGRTVFVIGEAGIGKSRLAAEFARHVESQGGRVVSGGTISGEASPYEAIVRTLRGALPMIAALDLKPMWLAAAATVLPELRHNDDTVPRLSALEPEREQSRLLEAMWRCFEGLARIRPLLIVLEDLHWAGQATIAFLTYLVERLGTAPIVLLVTYRDDETGPSHPLRAFRRLMQREHGVASLPLGGLSLADVESFIGRISGIDAGDGFSYRAHALSAGNAFFLGEIPRDSQLSGSAEPVLPASLQIAIGARVARLSENARSLLAVAATVGQTFATEIVSAASGFSEDQVLPCIDELLDVRFARVSTVSVGAGTCDFVFSHHAGPSIRLRDDPDGNAQDTSPPDRRGDGANSSRTCRRRRSRARASLRCRRPPRESRRLLLFFRASGDRGVRRRRGVDVALACREPFKADVIGHFSRHLISEGASSRRARKKAKRYRRDDGQRCTLRLHSCALASRPVARANDCRAVSDATALATRNHRSVANRNESRRSRRCNG